MQEHFQYSHLEGDIHHLVFIRPTREAVEQFFTQFGEIYSQHADPNEPIRLFVDLRPAGTIPPAVTTIQLAQSFFTPERRQQPLRACWIYDNSVMIQILQTFLDMLRLNSRRRFIHDKDYGRDAEAIDWLLNTSTESTNLR